MTAAPGGGAPEVLAGRVAIVTGGAAGIGGGVSRRFAEVGATVVINDIDDAWLAEAVSDISAAGGEAVPVSGDVRDPKTVARVVEAGLDAGHGRIDVLVNNVGDFRPDSGRRFTDSTEDDWAQLYAINLEHVLRCTRAVLPSMVEHRRGSIVNVSTIEAVRGIPGLPVYSAFKAGVDAFTRSLAVEVAKDGIRVNAIAPDVADTPQTPGEWLLAGRDPDMIRSWVPLGRWGQPDDFADVVLFLASDASRFVTGQSIPVDGGTLVAAGWYRRLNGPGWSIRPDDPG